MKLLAILVILALAAVAVVAAVPCNGPEPMRNGLSGYVNVTEYGAVGDGTHDDGPAIKAAAATGLPVFFPAGIYYVAQPGHLPLGWHNNLGWLGEDTGVGFEHQSWVKIWWTYPGGGKHKAWQYVLIESATP